jgi:hypothetical protein
VNFSEALIFLRRNRRLFREGWKHPVHTWIQLQVPDESSKMTLPYLYIEADGGDRVPWVPGQADILADDWALSA